MGRPSAPDMRADSEPQRHPILDESQRHQLPSPAHKRRGVTVQHRRYQDRPPSPYLIASPRLASLLPAFPADLFSAFPYSDSLVAHAVVSLSAATKAKTSPAFARRTSSDMVGRRTVVRALPELQLGSFECSPRWTGAYGILYDMEYRTTRGDGGFRDSEAAWVVLSVYGRVPHALSRSLAGLEGCRWWNG
ncbi:hypothetical protein C8F01DRAFT_1183588, partial [Mycena amicta]